jgi:hypothetical protein
MDARLLRWSAGMAVIVAALGGCANGRSPASAGHPTPTTRTTPPAGGLTPDRLQGGLLPSFGQLTPITAPKTGSYSSLPAAEVAAGTQQIPPGAAVKPANCRHAIWSGPDSAQFGGATAAVAAYRKPGDTSPGGVQAWEELVASAGRPRQAALGTGPVNGCDTVRVGYRGSSLTFAEQPSPSLGAASRGALLTPSSAASRRTRVVTFVGNGYVGVLLMQGKITKAQMNAFASAAYENASRKLG